MLPDFADKTAADTNRIIDRAKLLRTQADDRLKRPSSSRRE